MKEFLNKTLDKLKISQDYVVSKYRYHLRKLAIKKVKENLVEMKRVETDFTKDEMRVLIKKEEKKIIKSMGASVSLGVIASVFGLSTFR
tara:strand:- start:834 stop:1100 length:267 start_codon:yes stop_codon:yes gene_type:complete